LITNSRINRSINPAHASSEEDQGGGRHGGRSASPLDGALFPLVQHQSREFLLGDWDYEMARQAILALRGGPIAFRRGQPIFRERDRTDCLCLVVSGTIRSCKIFQDGRRQIVAFHIPGDLFGLNSGPEQELSAEAVTRSSVAFLRRRALLEVANRDKRVAGLLWAAATFELNLVQQHALWFTRNAKCRVSGFLVELARRLGDAGQLRLPMSRYDIADHLGLTAETVSRTFTELEQAGVIARTGARDVVLRNSKALQQMTD
jgi:CRP-like cAMP-binding protein